MRKIRLIVEIFLTAAVGVTFLGVTVILAVRMGRLMLFFLLAVAGTFFIFRAFTEGWKELSRN